MKKLILTTATVMLISLTAFAQDGGKCEKKCEMKEGTKDEACKKKCGDKACTPGMKCEKGEKACAKKCNGEAKK